MSKSILIVALMSLAGFASAAEIGLVGGASYQTTEQPTYGVTLGQKFDKFGVEASVEKTKKNVNEDRYGLVGSYDVLSVGKATVSVKSGVAYLNTQNSVDGYAVSVGTGVSYPVLKNVSVGADYRYQSGQDRVAQYNGNSWLASIKYKF